MVNHLYRGSANDRFRQSKMLHDWAQQQVYPVIAVGDYNYDLSPKDWHQHDKGFDLMVSGGVFKWVQPTKLLPTQGDSHYNSVLDFIFVSGKAQQWAQKSTILNPEDSYCPDTSEGSDHRPVSAHFEL